MQRARLDEHALDTVLGLIGDARPGVRGEIQLPLQDAVEDLLLRLAPERRHAAQQDVQDHARAPDVCFLSIPPPQHLRIGQMAWTSSHRVWLTEVPQCMRAVRGSTAEVVALCKHAGC